MSGLFSRLHKFNPRTSTFVIMLITGSSTMLVMKQIMERKLLIKIALVGPDLPQVVEYLENSKISDTSYLVLHYAPSALTLRHSLVPVIFPQCRDPLLQRDTSDTNCLYTANRLAKVVWNPIQNEAPAFYRFIQHFGISYHEYTELIETYNKKVKSEDPVDYDDIACTWLKQNKTENVNEKAITIYEHKLANMPLQGKPELYIGGIFPITGNKYRAPELAKGNKKLRLWS